MLWVVKSDPITLATDEIAWYVVQINANDIATTGAVLCWLGPPCCSLREGRLQPYLNIFTSKFTRGFSFTEIPNSAA